MTTHRVPRTHVRQPRRFKLVTESTQAFTVDISAGGLSFEAQRHLARGTQVTGSVQVSAHTYPFQGVVVWSTPGDARASVRARCGVRFTQVAAGLASAIGARTSTSAAPFNASYVPKASTVSAPVAASTSSSSTGLYATLTHENETWVVRVRELSGKRQEYRCAHEAHARKLLAALSGQAQAA